jgi:hypothetical protein
VTAVAVDAAAAVAADAVSAAAASGSVLAGADAADVGEAAEAVAVAVACELAAIAAAAIASGAVALPVAGAAAGTLAGARATGIATATGFGVVTAPTSCCARAVAIVAAAVSEVSEEGFAGGFAGPALTTPDGAADGCAESGLPAARPLKPVWVLASEGLGVLASRSLEPLAAAWLAGGASCDCVLSVVAGASAEGRWAADGWGAVEAAASLALSAAVLLSTSAPKLSFPDDGSDRAGRCGAPWKDTLVAASGVTLNTGDLLQ